MKIIFAGGRDFNNVDAAYKVLSVLISKKLFTEPQDFICVSGTAKGADTLFAEELKSQDVEIEYYPADWNDLVTEPVVIKTNTYGKKCNILAGHNRNTLMAKVSDVLVCVYNGSKGTSNMIETMSKLGKPVYIFTYNGDLKEVINEN